jgi:hypothetical protein
VPGLSSLSVSGSKRQFQCRIALDSTSPHREAEMAIAVAHGHGLKVAAWTMGVHRTLTHFRRD